MKAQVTNLFDSWIVENYVKLYRHIATAGQVNEDAIQEAYITLRTQPLSTFNEDFMQLFMKEYKKQMRKDYWRGCRYTHKDLFMAYLGDVSALDNEVSKPTICQKDIDRFVKRTSKLTSTQKMLYRLSIKQGYSNRSISDYLGVSVSTVMVHKARMMQVITNNYRRAI